MLYQTRDIVKRSVFQPVADVLGQTHKLVNSGLNPLTNTVVGRFQSATLESSMRLLKNYPKQGFRLTETEIGGCAVAVSEEMVMQQPFANLIRFKRKGSDDAPKLLFVAALSGHHATLGRETYREFLPDHDVYVTDWKDARYVPLSEGRFGFEDYVSYLIKFIQHLGPNTHVVGICQAAVPALVAAGIMAQQSHPARPKSLTLMAGPIDVRVNPLAIMKLTDVLHIDLFRLALRRVPYAYPGAGRLIYPGYQQLAVFIAMHLALHIKKHLRFFNDILLDNLSAVEKHREFYDEYMAVLDGTAEFYLETLERVFLNQQLPDGTMKYKGQAVDCDALKDIALLTLEGEKDDLCPPGQTEAAHHICTNIPDRLRRHYVQAGVGHYGIFNGSIYRREIAPVIKKFINQHDTG